MLAWAAGPPGTAARWTLRLDEAGDLRALGRDDGQGLALELTARPERPPVCQGPNGYSRRPRSQGYASLYYSFTRLATAGTVTVSGRTFRVRGTSWMDREVGSSQLAPEQVGWDWWSLRLRTGGTSCSTCSGGRTAPPATGAPRWSSRTAGPPPGRGGLDGRAARAVAQPGERRRLSRRLDGVGAVGGDSRSRSSPRSPRRRTLAAGARAGVLGRAGAGHRARRATGGRGLRGADGVRRAGAAADSIVRPRLEHRSQIWVASSLRSRGTKTTSGAYGAKNWYRRRKACPRTKAGSPPRRAARGRGEARRRGGAAIPPSTPPCRTGTSPRRRDRSRRRRRRPPRPPRAAPGTRRPSQNGRGTPPRGPPSRRAPTFRWRGAGRSARGGRGPRPPVRAGGQPRRARARRSG